MVYMFNIWGILMVNVTIYGIHGSYGLLFIIIALSFQTYDLSELFIIIRLSSDPFLIEWWVNVLRHAKSPYPARPSKYP